MDIVQFGGIGQDGKREIDWMALRGINLPLSFTGQEYLWVQLFKQFGLQDADFDAFFTGPAHLPWQRMGNVYGWMVKKFFSLPILKKTKK